MRAAQRPAPQGWPRGDGDGPLADGHAPVECGAHRVPPERRQRHAARVEPAGRGGTNGGGMALRPPFTLRRSTQSSPRDRNGGGGRGGQRRRLGRRAAGESCDEGVAGGWCAIQTAAVSGWGGGARVPCPCGAGLGDNAELGGGYGGRVRSVALATTRGCSGFHPLVFAGLAAPHFAHVRRGVMSN